MGDNLGAILVTGGAGYIGSHAAKALRGAGYHIVLFDNLRAGHREAALGATLVEGDVQDTTAVRASIRQHGITAVMHFAALLSVGDSIRDPAGYYRHNVGGTLSLLDAMASESVRQLVFSSTAAIYGEPIETPITETHPTQPISPYGETKLAVERAIPHYERAYGLRAIRLRYFNAAGADPDGDLGEDHEPELHIIPRAIKAAVGGPRLDVLGEDYPTSDGTCLRDFVHVSDLAQAHVLAFNALEAGVQPAVYNLSNGRPYSVRDVIAAVERVTGCRVPWLPAARRPGDPAVLFASSEKIRRELGWQPQYPELVRMVETAWHWHRTHPHGFAGALRTP